MFHTCRSSSDFHNQLSSAGSKLVVVVFSGSRCGPCKMIEPKVRELSRKYKEMEVLKVDVDKCADVADEYRISCMPTFVFMRNGKRIDRMKGADERALEYKITKMNR